MISSIPPSPIPTHTARSKRPANVPPFVKRYEAHNDAFEKWLSSGDPRHQLDYHLNRARAHIEEALKMLARSRG